MNKALNAVVEEIERVKSLVLPLPNSNGLKTTLANYERAWNNRDKTESDNFVEEYANHFLQQEPIPGIDQEYDYVKSLVPGITL
ncbi:hypothetical protein [Paraflavitalea speifideaquila]|uniref:hypothetical protein n=1 Tax=Paraflavitalea speifideaquila TaxID=3076558 RepID=UPI0028E7815A|nr:hypothetical protein [Paraflavitalea speifideiaquila]